MAENKKTRSIGLKIAMFGDVNQNGGMPDEMKQLAKTLKGTASFNTEANQTQDFYSEEEPEVPEETVVTEAGLKQIKLNFMEWDNDVLVTVFGGTTVTEDVTINGVTYNVEKYKAPKSTVQVEKAVRVISRYGVVIDVPRAKIVARFIWNQTNTDIAQIEVTATAQAPIGENDGPYEIYRLGEPKAKETVDENRAD